MKSKALTVLGSLALAVAVGFGVATLASSLFHARALDGPVAAGGGGSSDRAPESASVDGLDGGPRPAPRDGALRSAIRAPRRPGPPELLESPDARSTIDAAPTRDLARRRPVATRPGAVTRPSTHRDRPGAPRAPPPVRRPDR